MTARVSVVGRSTHDGLRASVTDAAGRNDIVLIDDRDVTSDEDSAPAASPGAKATVVNATVFYAAGGCAIGAVVVVVAAVAIFCRCSSRDKKRRHGNLIRRDASVFRCRIGPMLELTRDIKPVVTVLCSLSKTRLYKFKYDRS